MTARPNCNKKIPATIRNHLSPADLMCVRRFRATKHADMNPATPAITHRNISIGTTDRHWDIATISDQAGYDEITSNLTTEMLEFKRVR